MRSRKSLKQKKNIVNIRRKSIKPRQEIDGIIEMIKAQGITEKQKIIEDAEKAAQKMKEDAQARIEQELNKASDQLRTAGGSISVQMAEEIIKRRILPRKIMRQWSRNIWIRW